MTKLLRFLLCTLAALAFVQSASAARPSKPMESFENIPVETASGKALTAAQVQAAISAAATRREWSIKPAGPGALAAHIDVRQHAVDLIIRFDNKKYSLDYKDSKALGYVAKTSDTGPLIHPSYNKWLRTLVADIKKELRSM
ncbi:MAG TPA: hypothetical protein VL001_02515 [Candidimonas sp.]|nr:hypothetical protein [Candidimonas sp.]